MSKLLLLSGPIGCGKTEATRYLKTHFDVVDRKCKEYLYTLTQVFFCVSEDRFFEVYNDRALKEQPLPDFSITLREYNRLVEYLGTGKFLDTHKGCQLPTYIPMSVREAMIYVSELVTKPARGPEVFGEVRARAILPDELSIDDSCGGWVEEVLPAVRVLGRENVMLIRVYGRGTFEGDSRKYLPSDAVDLTVDIYNTGTEQEFLDNMLGAVAPFFKGEV